MLQDACLLFLARIATALVESVSPRVVDARVEMRKRFRLLEYGSTVVGNAPPYPLPRLIGVVPPYCCEFPTH